MPPASLFVAPRLRTLDSADASRRATWLELFYDLVYVVVVAALAHELSADHTGWGIVTFVALFVPVWWSWVGVTLYNDRFDTDDVGTRLITLLQMLGAAALALSVHSALHAPWYALAYVFVRILLIAQYLRAARHVPVARALCLRYATGFGIASAIWLLSLPFAHEVQFTLWILAMMVDIGTPLTARALQAKLPLSTSHLPERIGLFTIIVLGEAVAATVRGIASPTMSALAVGALGLAVAFAIWWLYFDNMDEHVVRRTRVAGQIWFYAHLPLVMGITAMAVGVEELAKLAPLAHVEPGPRWIMGGAVALSLAALGTIHMTTDARTGPRRHVRRAVLRFAGAALVLVVTAVAGALPAIVFGAALAVLGAAQVVFEPRAPATPVAS